jgi:hypothetical protein
MNDDTRTPWPRQSADAMTDRVVELLRDLRDVLDGMKANGNGTTNDDIERTLHHRLFHHDHADPDLVDAIYTMWRCAMLPGTPTERYLRRLMEETKMANPGQAPAIEAVLVLRGMASAIRGSLSETLEGGLRLLSPAGEARGGSVPMIEQFFDWEDVTCFGRLTEVKISDSALPSVLFPRTS